MHHLNRDRKESSVQLLGVCVYFSLFISAFKRNGKGGLISCPLCVFQRDRTNCIHVHFIAEGALVYMYFEFGFLIKHWRDRQSQPEYTGERDYSGKNQLLTTLVVTSSSFSLI